MQWLRAFVQQLIHNFAESTFLPPQKCHCKPGPGAIRLNRPHPHYTVPQTASSLCGSSQAVLRLSWFPALTLQQLDVYEQLQRQQHHHQNDTGHQETVEARRQQTDMPQRCPSPTARLQPVRPDGWGGRGGVEGQRGEGNVLRGAADPVLHTNSDNVLC